MSLRNLLAGPFAALTLLAAAPATAQHAKFPVSTDWLEQNLKNPKVRVVEVSVNPGLYERGHIPARPTSAGIPTGRHRQPRHRAARAVPGAAGARRHRRRYHHDPVRRQQQLVRGLGRLGVRHLRHPEREAAGRRPQEMGGRGGRWPTAPPCTRGQRPRQDANPRALQDVLAVARGKARRAGRYPLGRRIQRQDLRAQRRARAVRAGHVPGAVNVTGASWWPRTAPSSPPRN